MGEVSLRGPLRKSECESHLRHSTMCSENSSQSEDISHKKAPLNRDATRLVHMRKRV
jgi:hypothetical protein